MSIVSNNYYSNPTGDYTDYGVQGNPMEGPLTVPRFRLGTGVTSMAMLRGEAGARRAMADGVLESTPNLLKQERMDIGQQQPMRPQAYKDQSMDTRDGLASFFAAGSRYKERDAYTQNHISVSGIPGVVHMAVLDAKGQKIPFAPFSWGGRSYHCDAQGKFTILERQYFQNTINAENERTKYVTQLISLVVGAPASNVIAMFGMEFYTALGPGHPEYSIDIYGTYLSQAGFSPEIIGQKCAVFRMYADADASPEVMPVCPDPYPLPQIKTVQCKPYRAMPIYYRPYHLPLYPFRIMETTILTGVEPSPS